ncbi:MAG: hypothetical protein GXY86_07090 [Firmicutes bacterium]|nr:hypothetical protein [Bacillota bacterium]
MARLDRDVLAQSGVRWLLVFEGINDIGTAVPIQFFFNSPFHHGGWSFYK